MVNESKSVTNGWQNILPVILLAGWFITKSQHGNVVQYVCVHIDICHLLATFWSVLHVGRCSLFVVHPTNDNIQMYLMTNKFMPIDNCFIWFMPIVYSFSWIFLNFPFVYKWICITRSIVFAKKLNGCSLYFCRMNFHSNQNCIQSN